MKKICLNIFILGILSLLLISAAFAQSASEISLNGTWEIGKEPAAGQQPSEWVQKTVPFSVEGERPWIPSKDQFCPTAWFKRSFDIPNADSPRRYVLHFAMVNFACQVYVNDKLAGDHFGGFTPFDIDITSLVQSGANSLAVRVTDISAIYGSKLASTEGLMQIPYGTREFIAPSGSSLGWWGIRDNVILRVLPLTYINDIYVKPSVKQHSISAEVTINNTTSDNFDGVLFLSVLDGTKTALALPRVPVHIAAGQELVIPCQAASAAGLKMWWPHSPKLYHMNVRLEDTQGKILHQDKVRFGYREFWTEGERFILNGNPINLAASGLHEYDYDYLGSPADPRVVYEAGRKSGVTIIRLSGGPRTEHWYDVADEMGMLIQDESGIFGSWCHDNAENPEFWKNCEHHIRGWMRRDRNHPSVVIWGMSNEMGWEGSGKILYPQMRKLYKVMRQVDETRPVMAEGDGDVAGTLPIINLHYPELSYPGAMFPETAYWIEKTPVYPFYYQNADQLLKGKPLYIGEFSSDYVGYTGDAATYGGDRVFLGWQALLPVRGEVVQRYIEAHRWNNVAAIGPWTIFETGIIPNPYSEHSRIGFRPLAILLRDVDSHFYAGDAAVRRIKIANDSLADHRLNCKWVLTINGKNVKSGSTGIFTLKPTGRYPMEVKLTMPRVKQRIRAAFSITLFENGKVVDKIENTYWVFPQIKPENWQGAPRLYVYEPAVDKTRKCLSKLGVLTERIDASHLSSLKAPAVLVIGVNSVDEQLRKQVKSLHKFVNSGGVVLCLEQNKLAILPGLTLQGRGQHAINFVRSSLHSVMQSPWQISDEDLRWWHGGLAVCDDMYEKPTTGAFRVLADGGYGNRGVSTIEMHSGRGRWIASQLKLVSAFDAEPMAGELLRRMLRYAANQANNASPSATAAVCAGPEFTHYLVERGASIREIDSITKDSLQDCRLLIMQGSKLSGKLAEPQTVQVLKDFAEAGGTVYFNNLSSIPDESLAALLPGARWHKFEDSKVAHRGRSDITEGIGNSDLFWIEHGWGIATSSQQIGTQKLEIAGATALTEPALLQELRIGKGRFVIDQINWFETRSSKAKFLGSAILTNLGVGADLSKQYIVNEADFFQVSLNKYANRSLRDDKAGDGQGGWTDQGENDLRSMPTGHQILSGVPFDIVDESGGKAIVLAGGTLSYLPKKVENIGIGREAKSLIFLQGAAWCESANKVLWKYIIRYKNGEIVEVPVESEVNIRDWWNQPADLSGAKIAWSGGNQVHAPVTLYIQEWINPHPDTAIDSLDIISEGSAVPFIMAITGRLE